MAGATVDTKDSLLLRIFSKREVLVANECTALFRGSNTQQQEVKFQLWKINITNCVARSLVLSALLFSWSTRRA